MICRDDSLLLIIDVQDHLFPVMNERERLLKNLLALIQGINVFNIPILVAEQYPQGLGHTIEDVQKLLPQTRAHEKITFSCCEDSLLFDAIKATGKKKILIAGIEAHVCVYQTAMDLLGLGYDVHLIADAVSSRSLNNKQIALTLMHDAGAKITSTETTLFEILRKAQGEEFKQISQIVKQLK